MNYLLRRLAATLPVMAVVAVVVFLLIHLSPGDPAALIAGDLATTDDIDRLRVALGLDKPLPVQFVGWVGAHPERRPRHLDLHERAGDAAAGAAARADALDRGR